MCSIILKSKKKNGLSDKEIFSALDKLLGQHKTAYKRVLLIPPDYTRAFSYAGIITNYIYNKLKNSCIVDIMPALGTHQAMKKSEIAAFFGKIPEERFLIHNWQKDVAYLGRVSGSFVSEVSGGIMDDEIAVSINKRLFSGYDLILSIGQVVPHEVVGMSNYNKNLFVGCGGSSMIDGTHILGAAYGMERIIGRDFSPVHKVLDFAEKSFLKELPIKYILTVTTQHEQLTKVHGLFCGRQRIVFEEAVGLSQKKNITFLEKPPKKIIVMLDETEFKSAWLGNKAIYRTRMAIEDGGELVVIAPGVTKFGETQIGDRLIRKYGYIGKEKIMRICREQKDMADNLAVACHMIVSSPEGRFKVTYASKHLSKDELKHVGYGHIDYKDAITRYKVGQLKEGYNDIGGERVYYIPNPTIGLWAQRERFEI